MTRVSWLISLALPAVMAGCSSAPETKPIVRFTGYAYDYLDSRISPPLHFPADVHPLKQDNLFPVPSVKQEQGRLGPNVNLAPPSLLLAGDAGSTLTQVDGRTAVLLDLSQDKLWLLLQDFIKQRNVALQEQSDDPLQLLTDWVEWQDTNFWHKVLNSSGLKAKRERYLVEVHAGPSTRNSVLSWEQVARQEMQFGQDIWLNAEPNLSDETALINEFLEFYRAKQPKKLVAAQDTKTDLELSQNASGTPLYLLNQGFLSAWEKMPNLLSALGIKVTDKDQSLGTYFVEYTGPESSWKFWRKSEYPELPLKHDSFKIQLGELGERTSISIMDDKDRSLSISELQELLPYITQALIHIDN